MLIADGSVQPEKGGPGFSPVESGASCLGTGRSRGAAQRRALHLSRAYLFRQAAQQGVKDLTSYSQRPFQLIRRRLARLAWVAKPPSIFGERCCLVNQIFERRIQPEALLAKLLQIVRLAEREAVPRKKALERLFDRLLAVKDCIRKERWLGTAKSAAARKSLAALVNQDRVSATSSGSYAIDEPSFARYRRR